MPYQIKASLKLVSDKYIPLYDVFITDGTMRPAKKIASELFDPVEAENAIKSHVSKKNFIKQYGIINYDDEGNRLNSLNEDRHSWVE